MKKVKILCGGYGYTPPGTRRVKTVYAGGTVTVSDEEAVRLVALDAAEVIEDYPAAPVATPSNGGGSDEDTGGNADGGEDEGGDDQDDDDTVQGGTPPDLSVEGPVE